MPGHALPALLVLRWSARGWNVELPQHRRGHCERQRFCRIFFMENRLVWS